MKYIIAEKAKATAAGFKELTHRSNKGYMILNENEVRHNATLTGNIEERAEALGGELLNEKAVFAKVKNRGKYKMDKI